MMGGKHILEELPRRMFPTEAKRMRPRRRVVEIERLERRRPQVGAENGSPRVGEDVKRTGRRISGDGETGGRVVPAYFGRQVSFAGTRRAKRWASGYVDSVTISNAENDPQMARS